MAKDPAFLFYPNDYMGGTMGMTFEEKGAYVDLLMLQFNRGHIAAETIQRVVGGLWSVLQCKFVLDENGLYYNVRLDQEIEKRKNYTESRRKNVSGVNQYTKERGHMGGHMTTHMGGHKTVHMEDVNEDGNIDVTVPKKRGSRGKGFTPPTLNEVTDYCTERNNSINPQAFLNHYTSNGWRVGSNPMKDWRAAVRTWETRENGKPRKISEAERIMGL